MNLTFWDNENRDLSQSSLTIRVLNPLQEQELFVNLFGAFAGQKWLPYCTMVGCASNASQCVRLGGKEMFNTISIDGYTQAYFKSLYTLDNTFLSINCHKILIPCCFPKPMDKEKPMSSVLSSFPFKMPSLPTLSDILGLKSHSLIGKLISLIPDLPPMTLFSECDRTVGSGVAACLQYFSPIQFVTDFLNGNKDSLCCTHFRHNACIQGVRDAAHLAKVANLCPDSVSDELISTLTDSTVNSYITKSCKSFNAGKCVMDSVGDVVQTIQGFFTPNQQKPVITQIIERTPQLFNTNSGANVYTSDIPYNRNSNLNPNLNRNTYNSDNSFVMNPFREIINRGINRQPNRVPNREIIPEVVRPAENPLINKSIRDLLDRQYIPEASDVKPTKELLDQNQTTGALTTRPITSLFGELLNTKQERPKEEKSKEDNESDISSIFGSFGDLFGLDNQRVRNDTRNGPKMQPFFANFFGMNESENQTIVRDITDSFN
ncbi:unnamed protein product [Medioppia subpectinata]|uniref:Uncharacterized protein n=1 Tax=Medioppia subpectinata TaxID=1979941 RepID=A0A7R9KSN4_9ACAR|nr:unnamed protein product [Medioppia subpectinata]CAG2107907.1 unnamed protein product [Medioppia subpectinata]